MVVIARHERGMAGNADLEPCADLGGEVKPGTRRVWHRAGEPQRSPTGLDQSLHRTTAEEARLEAHRREAHTIDHLGDRNLSERSSAWSRIRAGRKHVARSADPAAQRDRNQVRNVVDSDETTPAQGPCPAHGHEYEVSRGVAKSAAET